MVGRPAGERASHSGCCCATYDDPPSAKSKNHAWTAMPRLWHSRTSTAGKSNVRYSGTTAGA